MEVRSGDANFFRNVYEDFFSVLMKIAYHITYSTDIAEDICQDAFIRFYDKNIDFPSYNDAKFWLIRVVKNLSINYVKRKVSEKNSLGKIAKEDLVFVNPFSDGVSELLLDESRQAVRKAVSKLPEKYRTVIVLKEYGDLNYKDIGKILNISESNVKVRVHRARKELEMLLGREEDNVS